MREVRRRKSKNSPVRQSGLKRILCIVALALCAAPAAMADVTFTVDPDLPAPEELLHGIDASTYMSLRDSNVVALSYPDDTLCFSSPNSNTFFKAMIEAFASHRPVQLSPDAIWMLISQGFSQHVNRHAEELRSILVDHEGRMELKAKIKVPSVLPVDNEGGMDLKDISQYALEHADWKGIVNEFSTQIDSSTKADIARIITTPFSTTGPDEHTAHQITLMESVKPYFEYSVENIACGIPYITLTGTPADWSSLLERTRELGKYGLDWWIDDLIPVLEEFVNAQEGRVNTVFWQSIVKKFRPGDLRGLSCFGFGVETEFDGWFLKFFPYDTNGRTPASVTSNHEMLSSISKVGFKFKIVNELGELQQEIPMELHAGIVGMEQDSKTFCLTPKIGWRVVRGTDDETLLEQLQKEMKFWLSLDIEEVPQILSRLDSITNLTLRFKHKVVVPEWMDTMRTSRLRIVGTMSQAVEDSLKQRLPNATIINLDLSSRNDAMTPQVAKPLLDMGTADSESGFSYVDLGLSVDWATFNLGAESVNDYGGYYAWKEACQKDQYTRSNYAIPTTDPVTELLGKNWRMPTSNEMDELFMNCTTVPDTIGGVIGCRIISEVPGYEDRSIFLPFAGFIDYTDRLSVGKDYCLWTSDSYDMENAVSKNDFERELKYVGMSVRPVHTQDANNRKESKRMRQEKPKFSARPIDLGMDVKWADRLIGAESNGACGTEMTYEQAALWAGRQKGHWRLPSADEIEELVYRFLLQDTIVNVNGTDGLMITSSNGGDGIFLPAWRKRGPYITLSFMTDNGTIQHYDYDAENLELSNLIL